MRSTAVIGRALGALAAILTCVALWPVAAGAATGPVHWTTPTLVDHTAPLSTATALHAVACPSSTTCIAVGANGTVVTTGAGALRTVAGVDGGATLNGVACPSTALCVIQEGSRVLVSTDPVAATPTWRAIPFSFTTGVQLTGITCASDSLCVAWGDSDTLEVSTSPAGGASAWKKVTLPPTTDAGNVEAVSCAPATTLCVASLTNAPDSASFATTTDPTGGASAWTETTQPGISDSPQALACASTTLCTGTVGGVIETSTNPAAGASTWSAGLLVSSGQAGFTGIACPSATTCLGAVSDGSVATSTNAGAGAGSYALSPVIDPAGLGTFAATPFACPTTAACVIPDRSPGLATVSVGPPPTSTTATGLGGTTAITGLSCPAVSLCVGVDDGGGILRSAAPTGPASGWRRAVQPAATTVTSSGRGLESVDCPSIHFCAAGGADDVVETTTHPATATQWTTTRLPFKLEASDGTYVDDLDALSCPSAGLCVAGNGEYGIIASTDPTGGSSAWHLDPVGAFNADHFGAVSCPTTTLCLAGDDFGRIAYSTTPGARAAHWKIRTIAKGVGSLAPIILSLSCPSTGFCLAGDSHGAVHWTTKPTGNPSAWHTVSLGQGRLVAVSCRSRQLCVAVNARNQAYATTNATGSKTAWHAATLPTGHFPIASAGAENLRTVTCAPHHFCVAASGAGVVFGGRTAK